MAQSFFIPMQSILPRPMPQRSSGLGQNMFGGPEYPAVEVVRTDFELRLSALESEVRNLKKESIGYLRIGSLPQKRLCAPLDIVVEVDGDGFIARTVDLPLYGRGEDPIEAIDMLKREIEFLYSDLSQDEDFTDDWLKIKRFLAERIID